MTSPRVERRFLHVHVVRAVIVLMLLAHAWPGRAQAPILTLDDVVRLALEHNRDIKLALQEVDKAAEQIDAAKSNRLPRVNLSYLEPALFTSLDLRLGPLGSLGLPNNFAFAIATVAQPLTQLHDIGLGVKATELSQDLASERVRAARQSVVYEVKRAYYGLLRAESGLVPAREAVGLFRELERLIGSLVEERAALDADRLEVQARRAQQEHDVMVIENAMATGRERLNVALARDPETPFAVRQIATEMPGDADLAAARARLLDQRPEVRQARIAVALAKTDLALKKAENRPKVNALFTYVGNINMPLLPGNIAAAVLQASWEPFDWGRKSQESMVKQIAVTQAEMSLQQLEAGITVELNARFRALREARSLVAVTELGERASREKLRVTLERQAEGTVLTRDLLQAQVSLAEAVHKYEAALLAYWEARADFEKATGEDR